jgi:hypothetical protein
MSSLAPTLTPAPNSDFSLLAGPAINPKTGAVTFKASVADAGTFSWLLTFQNGEFGAFSASRPKCRASQIRLEGSCRPAKIVFAKGRTAVSAAGVVSFTVKPSASAMDALERALGRGRGVSVVATLTFQSALGGSPVVHTRSITDRLTRTGERGAR